MKDFIELKDIDNYIYECLSDLLFNTIPGYRTIFYPNNAEIDFSNGVYLFMNEFATFLSDEIDKTPESLMIIEAFTFINSIGESNNLEVLNVLRVGILEILYTSNTRNREFVSNSLCAKPREYFNEFSKYYN